MRTALALPHLRAVLEAADWWTSPAGQPDDAPAGDVRALVEWLVARLPAGGKAPSRASATEEECRAIRDAFLASPWGRALDAPGRGHVVDALVDLAA